MPNLHKVNDKLIFLGAKAMTSKDKLSTAEAIFETLETKPFNKSQPFATFACAIVVLCHTRLQVCMHGKTLGLGSLLAIDLKACHAAMLSSYAILCPYHQNSYYICKHENVEKGRKNMLWDQIDFLQYFSRKGFVFFFLQRIGKKCKSKVLF